MKQYALYVILVFYWKEAKCFAEKRESVAKQERLVLIGPNQSEWVLGSLISFNLFQIKSICGN